MIFLMSGDLVLVLVFCIILSLVLLKFTFGKGLCENAKIKRLKAVGGNDTVYSNHKED